MARAIWKGAVTFGLVTVPVKLYSATASKKIKFHLIDRESGARIRNKRVSAATGDEVDQDDLVKGYELGEDRYVVLEPDELEALEQRSSHTIEITDFVDLGEIDPVFFDTTYYLAPDAVGRKPYALLMRAMAESGRAAIGRVVIRTKEHLCAIRPQDGALAMHTMLFHDEVVDPATIDELPIDEGVGSKELTMAKQLIDSLTTTFDPAAYRDRYREQVEQLIASKAEGKTITIEEPDEPAQVVDLLEALKASVEQAGERDREGGRRKRRSA